MRKQVFFVAMMALLLVAGMCTSAVCEVTCAPPSPTGACCPQQVQTQQASDHCAHSSGKVIRSVSSCAHPDDSGITAINLTVQNFQPGLVQYASADAVASSIAEAGAYTLPAIALLRRSSITPLRI